MTLIPPITSSQLIKLPLAAVGLDPVEGYEDTIIRGSASFSDPDGNPEGVSTYRWLVNGNQLAAGDVPQSLLLSLDGSLLSTDGQAPVQSQGLSYVPGRFGQAVQISEGAASRLVYSSNGNVNPNEGTLEMWVNLTYDLDDPAYDDSPRLFSYVIDNEHQLYVAVSVDHIIIASVNKGNYYSVWPDLPPNWQAGEWHHLAVTWSASAERLAVYYDCLPAAEGNFAALTGSASSFSLGGADRWNVMDAAFDDVRLSRRALSDGEIASVCSRGAPAPNDEVVLLPGQLASGDLLTFELTPCDDTGACGSPAITTARIVAPPLGVLEPKPGVLPAGTSSVTLNLTTTMPANCRWSEQPNTPYDRMQHDFQQGQGSTVHSTVVSGLSDLDDRWFYVRCADTSQTLATHLSTLRHPDTYERWTHLRILGSWDDDYPRIANMWGTYDSAESVEHLAAHDLLIPFGWGNKISEAATIRAINPSAKILLTQNATYGWPERDLLTAEWWNSTPGDPGYNCLLRNSRGDILLVDGWGHPMYNMTVPYCRTLLAQQSVDAFLLHQLDQNYGLIYDGVYWDRVHDAISWLSNDVDSNLDRQPDDPNSLDKAYQAGIKDFLSQVRAQLPHAILMGNDCSIIYETWLNGCLYEWQLALILNGSRRWRWDAVITSYRDWTGRGHHPRTTFIESAPEAIYFDKYTFDKLEDMPPAMEAEAAASYQRMRYGLTSALLGDGLFAYDFTSDWHRSLWWYDEYGAIDSSQQATTLPSPGYLGQPAGDPFALSSPLETPDQVANGGFEDGPNNWRFWVDSGANAVANFEVNADGGVSGTAASHIAVTSAPDPWAVELFQTDLTTVAGQNYTVSFWARSSVTRTIQINVIKQTSPWADYGFNVQTLITPQWQHYHLWDDAGVTAEDGKLQFLLGDKTGEVWLDNIQFQAGALGVWAREFDHGLAVVNMTEEVQTVSLPGSYCKLNGNQAPLFQDRVDDDEARISSGWRKSAADFNQFGKSIHLAAADSAATVTYTPDLAYSGTYEVLAWVAPAKAHSSDTSVTIHHMQGETTVTLDQTAGEVGWHSLGTYSFQAGTNSSAVLKAAGDGTVVADAFKWVSTARYNDGSRVSQITLQPRDGIILLSSSCYASATWQNYVPLTVRS